jgi:GLPGLI family protein
MKRLLSVLLLLAVLTIAKGQSQEGVIGYSTKMNMHKRIPADQEEMKKMIPEFSTSQNELVFLESQSLYKPVVADENPFDTGGGGQRMSFRMVLQNETFLDRELEEVTHLRDFMGKKYLIKNDMKRIPWKLGEETRIIKGYNCKNASFTDENQREIEAWYTEEIRLPLGPESYFGLPGLILEVLINQDEVVISSENIALRPLKKNELKEPKGGIEMTDEDYKLMVKEQMEKMAGQRGAGNVRMMIRN